jgi:hypothetical protein
MSTSNDIQNSELSTTTDITPSTAIDRFGPFEYEQEPVGIEEITDLKDQFLMMESTGSSRSIGIDNEMRERRESAISIGIRTLNKRTLRNWKPASRRVQEDVFIIEFSLLEALLHKVRRGNDADGFIRYAPFKDEYLRLISLLKRKRTIARETFICKGISLPKLPSWGNDFGVDDFIPLIEFEIVAICFRAEVEDFCRRLDAVFDFDEARAKGVNSDASDSDDLYETQHTTDSISGFRREVS